MSPVSGAAIERRRTPLAVRFILVTWTESASPAGELGIDVIAAER